MSIGFWQIAIVVILVVLLFGRGKISSLMGDVAKGIKSFKKGMATDVTDDSQTKNIFENHTKCIKKQSQIPPNSIENPSQMVSWGRVSFWTSKMWVPRICF